MLAFDFRGSGDSEGLRERFLPLEHVADIRATVAHARNLEEVDASRVAVLGTLNGASAALQAASEDPAIAAVIAFFPFGDGETWMRSLRRYWEWRLFQKQLQADRVTRSQTGKSKIVDADSVVLVRGPERLDEKAPHPELERSSRGMSLESAEAIVEFKPQRIVGRIAPRPVLIIGVEEDLMIPIDEVLRLHSHLGDPKILLTIPDISHHEIYREPHYSQLIARIAADVLALWAR